MAASHHHAICTSKPQNTRDEAEALAREQGIEWYPCPYSVGERHWHTGRSSKSHLYRAWFDRVNADARMRGGMGYPAKYIVEQIRKRRQHGMAVDKIQSAISQM